MAAKECTDSGQLTAHLDRADVERAEDGSYLLPVVLGDGARRKHTLLRIDPDDAARLSAQLDFHLNKGWAMSEQAKAARRSGDDSTL